MEFGIRRSCGGRNGVSVPATSFNPRRENTDLVVDALSTFRAARSEADYSPFYPRPLGNDAREAICEARAVIRTRKGWIRETT